MFDRQLAKWRLEKEGYLASMDVALGALGVVDVVGIKTPQQGAGRAVFGVVRGWWHGGAYLTPGLIRNHLQTERRLLDRTFSAERLKAVMRQFDLPGPPDKVLFYSKRSPSMSDEAERELGTLGVRVVYLEEILAAALAEARADELGPGSIFQALAMVKGSHIFKEMVRLARQAERVKTAAEEPRREPSRDKQQLDFLAGLLMEDEGGDDPTA